MNNMIWKEMLKMTPPNIGPTVIIRECSRPLVDGEANNNKNRFQVIPLIVVSKIVVGFFFVILGIYYFRNRKPQT